MRKLAVLMGEAPRKALWLSDELSLVRSSATDVSADQYFPRKQCSESLE